ncbi:DUF3943 domain-containing protein [Flavobacterium eburneipallidum]|uniref:DUF3943 domain-containing protein n=1 Tax=Flavobacterium eburneipallidum TaxID=3003263 RepID=UPI002482501A|nr:DUF3943 domain-containing protein [Flavobacterium eburneipallidum]
MLLLICTPSFAEDTLVLSSSTSVIDSTLVSSNETIIVLDTNKIVDDSFVSIQKKDSLAAYPPQFKDYRRLGYNTGIFAGAAIIGFGVLWAMPESATNWDKEEMRKKGILWKWKQNVKEGPVWDKDDWVLNWVTHPYCGGVYYMTARSSGFNRLESFGYSALMSTFFWEYGIESFAEVPSVQDLIITPVVGSVVGEGFFYAKKSIVRHNHKILKSKILGYTALMLMDPFNTILDRFGYKERVKTQMNFAPVGVNQFSKTPVWGVSFSASF